MRSWLKNARVEKGYTLKQMGKALDIGESYYCRIEKAERQKKMKFPLAFRLSAVLGLPISVIAAYESEPHKE